MATAGGLSDFYELLGVRRDASPDEIKRAYRQRARELHPDANGGDPQSEAKFKEVSVAYEVLRDPERRARYDRFGPEGVFGSAAGGGAGFDFDSGLSDLFEAFFGSMGGGPGRGGPRGPVPGADAEVSLQLGFAEAVFGAQRELSVRLPVTCDVCQGTGAEPGTEPVRCADCQGSGEIRRIRQSLLGQVVTSVACGRCHGMGETIPSPCKHCHGEGRRMEDRSFSVAVPAGVEHGSTLRLADRGPAGPRGGGNGSLFVHLAVTPDPRFERHGDDLHTTVHVSMTQAALGARFTVQALEQPGVEEEPPVVELAAGTQSGHVHRVKGLGVPHLRGRGRGDLFVHLEVDTPTHLDSEQEELLRRLAAARGEDVSQAGTDGVFSRIRSAFG